MILPCICAAVPLPLVFNESWAVILLLAPPIVASSALFFFSKRRGTSEIITNDFQMLYFAAIFLETFFFVLLTCVFASMAAVSLGAKASWIQWVVFESVAIVLALAKLAAVQLLVANPRISLRSATLAVAALVALCGTIPPFAQAIGGAALRALQLGGGFVEVLTLRRELPAKLRADNSVVQAQKSGPITMTTVPLSIIFIRGEATYARPASSVPNTGNFVLPTKLIEEHDPCSTRDCKA